MITEKKNSEVQNYELAEEPIINELSKIGFSISTVMDLLNSKKNYKSAIPILLNWLPKVENPYLKESIVRVLSVPWARGTIAPHLMINEYRKAPNDSSLKWAIGNAISIIADESILEDIFELINDKSNGNAREMLVVSLGRMKLSQVESLLISLLHDEDLIGYSLIALRKLKSTNALPIVKSLESHPRTWVRNEAKKYINSRHEDKD